MREAHMAADDRDELKAASPRPRPPSQRVATPRDTDHPTGSKQAAENGANDPPS
jgi:hypothetical protein